MSETKNKSPLSEEMRAAIKMWREYGQAIDFDDLAEWADRAAAMEDQLLDTLKALARQERESKAAAMRVSEGNALVRDAWADRLRAAEAERDKLVSQNGKFKACVAMHMRAKSEPRIAANERMRVAVDEIRGQLKGPDPRLNVKYPNGWMNHIEDALNGESK